MPEIKNSFIQGKMNQDLDERLVPNGQYREATNVEVATSEGSDVGTVQNILGNYKVEQLVGDGFSCVGSIANEKTNKLYWFISSYEKDVILEYDADNDIATPVVVDLWSGTQKAVLKFFGNTITGINIIDNLLFWTDNQGEPKKINIDASKEGTADINSHTQLSFEKNSFIGVAIDYGFTFFSQTGGDEASHPPLTPLSEMDKEFVYFSCSRRKLAGMLGMELNEIVDIYGRLKDGYTPNDTSVVNISSNAGYPFKVRHYRDGELLGIKDCLAYDNESGVYIKENSGNYVPWRIGDLLFGIDSDIDIQERHITVIKEKPLAKPSVKINYTEQNDLQSKTPNLFELKFPRFSYRYKYRDGEFSAFAPFTEPVFNPQYTKDTTKSIDGSVLYNQDSAYDIKEPHNKAMVNAIHSVELMDFITIGTSEDVVSVDILYKQEDSPVVYSIGTIAHTDLGWHTSNYENDNLHINGAGRYPENLVSGVTSPWMASSNGGYNSGKYLITTENIYAAMPANQILRPWDNVPRKALAQEVTGSRIVYGNYLQNYTIGTKPIVHVEVGARANNVGSFASKGLPSIKSQRNYQLGVIYCDEFGRETPVFTSNSGAIDIPWQDSSGGKNASKSSQLVASVVNNFPDWVDSIKFFIKENSSPYYNLSMERAWVGKNTYNRDNSEGHLWISFPSSDRNKITEDDYIVLKKKIGLNEGQVAFENKFKVIGIENEAPDSIKYELVNQGVVSNVADSMTTAGTGTGVIFPPSWSASRPDKLVNNVIIQRDEWVSGAGLGSWNSELADVAVVDDEAAFKEKNLYISWSRISSAGTVVSSKKYCVTGGSVQASSYSFILDRVISSLDADLAHLNSDHADDTTTELHPDLHFQIERKELKEAEDFSGQFFVKISKNQITSIIETGAEISNLDKFSVIASQPVWHWRDDTNAGAQTNSGNPHHWGGGGNYGNTNYFGDTVSHASADNIQNTGGGNSNLDSAGNTARLTDWHLMWENVLGELTGKPRWFVDAMHMACGQSETSDYAKFSCVTWAGATKGQVETTVFGQTSNNKSAWGYPPVKKWFSEYAGVDEAQANQIGGYWGGAIIGTQGRVSESPLFDPYTEWEGEPAIDGWIGSPQTVSRRGNFRDTLTTTDDLKIAGNHINGLEGMVTTNEFHTTGPRRWFGGMDGESFGNGNDTHTYSSNETKGHFMHLSFFAPGKDLHDNSWHLANPCMYGDDSWMDNLQGIWGGGVFTGPTGTSKFGSDSDDVNKHPHLAMEGNYAAGDTEDYQVYETAPGPGSGYGYKLENRELHERQWDPTFNSEGDANNNIRDFIRNLYPGSRFRFNRTGRGNTTTAALLDDQVYTIKKVSLKKLYNHTTWRNAKNIYYSSVDSNGRYDGYVNLTAHEPELKSVEQVALEWLDAKVDADGDDSEMSSPNVASVGVYDSMGLGSFEVLKKKIVDFGSAHNRRCCYVIELNENPVLSTGTMGNPLNMTGLGSGGMNADLDNDNNADIEFLDPVQDLVLSDLSKFPAIWELSPLKQDVDLDIYYEASSNIPVRINNKTNELFAPKGCKVEIIDVAFSDENECQLVEWNNNVAVLSPGFNVVDNSNNEIDYSDAKIKFTRKDGGYTIAEAGAQQLVGSNTQGFKTSFIIKSSIGSHVESGLAWYNCFSFGNGLESNRVRDDFNAMFIRNGVKASTTTQETYKEENRKHGLIFSGLYNSNSGINDLNQFIMAEKITKDLNPTYGSIQKLFSRDSDLVAFCEDKVVKVLANKDAVFNADGNPQLVANQNVLGQTVPFEGQYGISKNPESFASESYRAYFTDRQRGAVLRLSKDGLTPISSTGMHDWFRDNLPNFNNLVGTYDSYKENYNITLNNRYTENIIFNTFFRLGSDSEKLDVTSLSSIPNGLVSGSQYSHSWETKNLDSDIEYIFDTVEIFTGTITVTNHPAIPVGHYQLEQFGSGTAPTANVATSYQVLEGYVAPTPDDPDVPATPFEYALFDPWSSLPLNGEFTMLDFNAYSSSDIWDGNTGSAGSLNNDIDDNNLHTNIRRCHGGTVVIESSTTNARINGVGIGGYSGTYPFASGYEPDVEKPTGFLSTNLFKYSQCITRTTSANSLNDQNILFDRVAGGSATYVEVDNIGVHPTWNNTNNNGTLNATYVSNGGNYGLHNSFYNGDELHVEVEIFMYPQYEHPQGGQVGMQQYGSAAYPFNGHQRLVPWIQVLKADVQIGSADLVSGLSISSGGVSSNPYTECASTPGDVGLHPATGPTIVDGTNGAVGVAYACVQDTFASSGGVQFPEFVMPLMPYNSPGATIKIGCSFKFKDSSQQNTDGTFSGAGNDLITDEKIIDALTIRVGHNTSAGGVPFTNSAFKLGQSNYPLKYPQWEIRSIKAIKGHGVIDVHSDYIAGIDNSGTGDPGNSGTNVTYYDDLTTSGLDGLTTTDITNAGGAWDSVLGAYVLNQSAIDSYVSSPLGGSYYQPNIPATAVDGFVEVSHSASSFAMNQNSASFVSGAGSGQWYQSRGSSHFGNSRGKVLQQYNYHDPLTGNNTGSQVTWYSKGADPGGQTPQENNHGNPGDYFSKSITTNTNGTNNYIVPQGVVGTLGSSGTTPSTVVFSDYQSDWWRFKGGVGTSGGYSFETPLLNSETWATGWYLVDIELDEILHPDTLSFNGGANPSIATGGANGSIMIKGVVDAQSGSVALNDDLALTGGVGVARGGNSNAHAECTWHWRDGVKYGDQRWVLRSIFYVDTNSNMVGNTDLVARIYNMENVVYIHKVNSKRIDYTNGTGTATSWYRNSPLGGTDQHAEHQYHSLSQQKAYLHSSKLCYDMVHTSANYLAGTSTGHESWWKTNFASGEAPEDVGAGWIFKFLVVQNPKTNDPVNGQLGCLVTNNKGPQSYNVSADEITGAHLRNITQEGEYEVGFDMTGTQAAPNWYVNRNGVTDTTGVILQKFGTSWSNTNVNSENCVGWYNAGGTMVSQLSMGIGDMILTNQDTVFSGGTAGSWDFDGFDSTSEQFITWDIYWDPNGAADGRIQFRNCPSIDTTFGNGNVVVMANQYIDKVINRYEKYEITFNFRMETQDTDGLSTIDGQGLFHMYYFNAAGYGFRINDIGDENFSTFLNTSANALPNYNKEAIYDPNTGDFLWWRVTKIVGIGDGSIFNPTTGNGNVIIDVNTGEPAGGTQEDAYSEFLGQNSDALRDTLVIRRDPSDSNILTGWMDDITMKRVYEIPLSDDGYAPDRPTTTVSFSEAVKGWTSFKSFVPESGLSLSKKYFTISGGRLHEHYYPLKWDGLEYAPCELKHADNYNRFYNYLGEDAFKASSIQAVLNAEPSAVKTFNTINYEGSQAYIPIPTTLEQVSGYNSQAWISGANVDGWRCTEIKTDLDVGHVNNFIKKEGKWFGYIRGKMTDAIDTSLFSVQGLGVVEGTTQYIPPQ